MSEAQRPSTASIWLSAARPKTLGAAFAPVFIGACMAFADGVLDLSRVLTCLIGAVIIQLGTNFANDYFDFVKGADTEARVGPVRATAAGWVTPGQMLLATVLTFLALTPIAIYLIAIAGWPIVIIGVLSVICGIAYTGGPYPLAYVGLGDLFVLVFFGPVAVAGTYYTQALAVPPEVLIAGFIPGLLSTALLAVNNLRDIETDARAGKRTLAVMLGRAGTRREYGLLLGVAYLLPLLLWLAYDYSLYVLISWLTLPLAYRLLRAIFSRTDGPGLNAALADTARLSLLFSLLLAVGIVLS